MGVVGCCKLSCAVIALAVALFIGYANTKQHALGAVFATIFKLQGLGKPGTEPVPDDLAPMPRPKGEILLQLPDGDQMPANGIGMCCRPTAYDPTSVYRTVLWFLLQGGRHIDTASMYLNHESVGAAMKEAIARGIPRKDIFLTTKLWASDFGYKESIARTRDMLKELQVDYIDLLLLHAPIQLSPMFIAKYYKNKLLGGGGGMGLKLSNAPEMVELRVETWKGLSTLKAEGVVRNIGVSNFNIQHMKQIQDLKLAPIAANQLQFHPWAPEFLKDIVSYCHQNKIAVTGYFSLGGFDHKEKALGLDTLNQIAKSHGRRPAQILLRWSLQKNVSIIPGTGNHKHMADNLGTYGFSLSDAEMKDLDGMASLPLAEDFMFFDF
eukprot:TRINITY_DN49333_c0_g1_i1.p1 TRINITY_DN49333_c0_g1~~TRINITY_DN49333_c0_g1_i1.p1  ORF type:complete len:396 (-),score=70.72 TRINITY_DN49333_c0_g1_i1:203-1342(-)